MPNAFVHQELNTTDPGKARSFYGQLFDWTFEDMPMGDMGTYTVIKLGDKSVGGVMRHPVPGAPSMWLTYVSVDDIRASTDKAKSLGATILQDAVDIPKIGIFSILQDPTGATIALFQPKM
jgi:predicted enzyme related to lactoylglutathione lyase